MNGSELHTQMNILKKLRNRKYRNAEMVSYWKTKDLVEAKLMKHPDGYYVMQMEGEKYPFPGHPRGSLLYGKLSPLKHWIKNKVFNDSWALLEERREGEIPHLLAEAWPFIFNLAEEARYDMVPFEQFQPPVKELHRALTKVGVDTRLVDILCFIFQEDDAYRWRFQWLAKFRPTNRKRFTHALDLLEHAEMIGDMKERIRLLKRVLLFIGGCKLEAFLKEMNWKRFQLTKADKYFFRAKYFKVDFPEYQY